MKNLFIRTLVATAAVFIAAAPAQAATDAQREKAREQWESMTPEQQAEARAKARAKWDSMTPEEKAAAKEKGQAKWESMTPEEQAEAKKRFAEKRPRAAERMKAKEKAAAASAAQ